MVEQLLAAPAARGAGGEGPVEAPQKEGDPSQRRGRGCWGGAGAWWGWRPCVRTVPVALEGLRCDGSGDAVPAPAQPLCPLMVPGTRSPARPGPAQRVDVGWGCDGI